MITAIVPAFNEEKYIGSIVLLTKQYVDKVIVIDDGSSDHTEEIAKLAGAQVIRHSFNRGKGAALKTGFEAAKGADIIVTIDSDGQHDPADIPKLIIPIKDGVSDMVIGSRYLNDNGKNTPAYRRLGQIVLDKIINVSYGLRIKDTQSGFRAFAKSAVPMFRFKQSGMAIESEMLIDAYKARLRIGEVEIAARYINDKLTFNLILKGLKVLTNVIFMIFRPFQVVGLHYD